MPEIILGILGGGQLGSMLSLAAKKINIKTLQHKIFVMNSFMENMMINLKFMSL